MSNGRSRTEYTTKVVGRRLDFEGSVIETSHMVSYPSKFSQGNKYGRIDFATDQFVGVAVERCDGTIVAYFGSKRLGEFSTPESGVEAVIDFSRAERETYFATRGAVGV